MLTTISATRAMESLGGTAANAQGSSNPQSFPNIDRVITMYVDLSKALEDRFNNEFNNHALYKTETNRAQAKIFADRVSQIKTLSAKQQQAELPSLDKLAHKSIDILRSCLPGHSIAAYEYMIPRSSAEALALSLQKSITLGSSVHEPTKPVNDFDALSTLGHQKPKIMINVNEVNDLINKYRNFINFLISMLNAEEQKRAHDPLCPEGRELSETCRALFAAEDEKKTSLNQKIYHIQTACQSLNKFFTHFANTMPREKFEFLVKNYPYFPL